VSEEITKLWLNHVLFQSIRRKHSTNPFFSHNFLSNTHFILLVLCPKHSQTCFSCRRHQFEGNCFLHSLSYLHFSYWEVVSEVQKKKKHPNWKHVFRKANSVADSSLKHGLTMHDHVEMFHSRVSFLH